MRRNYKILVCAAAMVVLLICVFPQPVFWLIGEMYGYGDVYETDNYINYGEYIGNFDNEAPTEFISSFFPETIEDYFTDITYHYKAKKLDSYAYEAYLEFEISDKQVFNRFLESTLQKYDWAPMKFDSSYMECVISNVYDIDDERIVQEDSICIHMAQIGKILISQAEQRFIFVAIGVYDGGGTKVNELDYFFSRFDIDPIEYERSAFASPYYQEQGITNEKMYHSKDS